jgi:hypothetical protein
MNWSPLALRGRRSLSLISADVMVVLLDLGTGTALFASEITLNSPFSLFYDLGREPDYLRAKAIAEHHNVTSLVT